MRLQEIRCDKCGGECNQAIGAPHYNAYIEIRTNDDYPDNKCKGKYFSASERLSWDLCNDCLKGVIDVIKAAINTTHETK